MLRAEIRLQVTLGRGSMHTRVGVSVRCELVCTYRDSSVRNGTICELPLHTIPLRRRRRLPH
eukprot:COSAG06_NODE_10444_length_1680_cov_1.275142_1_plen_61_part_10